MLLIEGSATACDGVQSTFEELVEKITQTPGLWESEDQNEGVKLSHREEQRRGSLWWLLFCAMNSGDPFSCV